MKPLLLAYPGHESLAEPLRRALHADAVAFELRSFPDGETYLRIDSDVQDRDIVILCTLREPDARVLPLIYMSDTLRELGARAVGLVAPYLAYMRQDRRFHPGEALTSTSFANLLSVQVDWLVTVDPHLHRPHLHRRNSLAEIYSIPTAVAHAAPLITTWIRANVTAPLVVGPDAESEQWVSTVANAIPCPYIVLTKTRRGDRDVSISTLPDMSQWNDLTPVLVDDIISSARTLIETTRRFASTRLAAPICVGVHGVFAAQAYQSLRAAGASRIVTTNSIAHPSNEIDLTPLLVEPVTRLLDQHHPASSTAIASFAEANNAGAQR